MSNLESGMAAITAELAAKTRPAAPAWPGQWRVPSENVIVKLGPAAKHLINAINARLNPGQMVALWTDEDATTFSRMADVLAYEITAGK